MQVTYSGSPLCDSDGHGSFSMWYALPEPTECSEEQGQNHTGGAGGALQDLQLLLGILLSVNSLFRIQGSLLEGFFWSQFFLRDIFPPSSVGLKFLSCSFIVKKANKYLPNEWKRKFR